MSDCGWIIQWHWYDDVWVDVLPDPNASKYSGDRYHTHFVYPFKSVAKEVAYYLPKMSNTVTRVIPLKIINN